MTGFRGENRSPKKEFGVGRRVERRILAGVPFLLYRPRHDPSSWPPRKAKKLFQPCPKIINNNHHAQSAIRIITQNNTPSFFFFPFFFFFFSPQNTAPLSLSLFIFCSSIYIYGLMPDFSWSEEREREKARENVSLAAASKTLAIFFFFFFFQVHTLVPRKSRITLLFIIYCFFNVFFLKRVLIIINKKNFFFLALFARLPAVSGKRAGVCNTYYLVGASSVRAAQTSANHGCKKQLFWQILPPK